MVRRHVEPPRDLDGLPIVSPLEERLARAAAILATAWFVLAAMWELFGPVLAGHYASSASVGIIAENMLHHKIAGPVWDYTAQRPPPSSYYCHHPWGIFWSTAAVMAVVGRHDVVCRIVPVLLSAMTPPLLYAIGKAMWRPAAGAAAALGFVVLPITLAFASFNALEVPVIAWSLLALWGYVRLSQTGRRRYLWASVAGAFFALNADWPAFLLIGGLLGLALIRLALMPRALGPIADRERLWRWWALTAAVSVGTFGLYVALFQSAGKLGDLLASYGMRSSGNAAPLTQVLASRRYWIELSFTPIAIGLGKVAAAVALLRLLVLRRDYEALPLLVLAMAAVQYLLFKQGADIHVFWPHYFAAFFALGLGALVATAAPALDPILRGRDKGGLLALGVATLPVMAIARDGVPALRYAHATGGRFNEKGLIIESDGAKTAFLKHVVRGVPKTVPVDMHEGMKHTWAQTWALGGRPVAANRPPPERGGAIYVADTTLMRDAQQADLARRYAITAVGPYWRLSAKEAWAPIEGWSFTEREPSWWSWYWVTGTEPERRITKDAYWTWQLRVHFDQRAEAPVDPPATFEQKLIAHNIAVAAGDGPKASAILAEIERDLTKVKASFDDGTAVVGTRYEDGARPLLTIVLRAGGPIEGDAHLSVKSKVIAKAPWSLTMADPTDREVGLPLPISPARWKKGFLYSDRVPIQKRPGTEVFRAFFSGRAKTPKLLGSKSGALDVLTLR